MNSQVTPAPNLPESHRDHERSDIKVRGIIWCGLALGGGLLLCLGLMRGMFVELSRRSLAQDAAISLVGAPQAALPPRPRLQQDPQQDLARFRIQEDRQLQTYGWIDKPQNIVRIPIDQAMELLLKRGLPQASASASASKETEQSRSSSAKSRTPVTNPKPQGSQ